jgi:alpha-galactosidase
MYSVPKLLGSSALLLALAQPILAQKATPKPDFHQWAATPPMGWNSWDCYGPTVTEAETKANADYMAKHLKASGWEYVVVDIRWYVGNDTAHGYNEKDPTWNLDQYGRFVPAPNRFPSAAGGQGFKPLADYMHAKGLKFCNHLKRGVPVQAVQRQAHGGRHLHQGRAVPVAARHVHHRARPARRAGVLQLAV